MSIRSHDWKLITEVAIGQVGAKTIKMLFSIKDDPKENLNLVDKKASKARELEAYLTQWLQRLHIKAVLTKPLNPVRLRLP